MTAEPSSPRVAWIGQKVLRTFDSPVQQSPRTSSTRSDGVDRQVPGTAGDLDLVVVVSAVEIDTLPVNLA